MEVLLEGEIRISAGPPPLPPGEIRVMLRKCYGHLTGPSQQGVWSVSANEVGGLGFL